MLSPTDAAWSVLEEGHRVEKIAPIIPAALVGAAAYQGLRNAGFSLRDKEGNFSPGFRGSATVADPLGGVVASKEIEDPNALERGAAVATQVLPVGAGIKAVRGIGRGAKTAVEGIRQADRAQAVARAVDAEKAARAAAANARRLQMSQRVSSRRPGAYRATDAEVDEAYRIAEDAAQISRTRNAALHPLSPKAPPAGGFKAGFGRGAGFGAGLGVPLAYGGYKLGQFALDNLMPEPMDLSPMAQGQGGIAPMQGTPTQGFQLGGQGGGIGGVQNVGVSGMADKDIFQGKQFQSAPTSSNMATPSIAQKGMPMSLGNELIKSALHLMDKQTLKAKPCPKCGKKGCVSKMGCVAKAKCPHCDGDGPRSACICGKKEKAEGKKKPAHGMVIVIGSKAGPGPSTDGKRDDKKDDKE